MISSNIDINTYIQSENADTIWLQLLYEAEIIHTQDWECCVVEIIDRFNVIQHWDKNKEFKNHHLSRKEAFDLSKQYLKELAKNRDCWKQLNFIRPH